ncbi:hypothetical protein C0389_00645 [bacterium]|nr:hypothetical protein [bacterium]
MSITGDFNTDASALQKRIQSHVKFGSKEINEWIFENMELSRGISIVDLGCGTGKQSIPMSQIIGVDGTVLSVDISQDALNSLSLEAKQKGLNNRIKLLCCDLDNINNHLEENAFNRALSSFSLYYSQNPYDVIKTIWKLLKNDGLFFFCGPAKDNNAELKSFHNKIKGVENTSLVGGALFMEITGRDIATEIFGEIEVFHFENKLKFNSHEALFNYWSSYNLYDKNIENKFISEAISHFKKHSSFETTKRVIGVKAKK